MESSTTTRMKNHIIKDVSFFTLDDRVKNKNKKWKWVLENIPNSSIALWTKLLAVGKMCWASSLVSCECDGYLSLTLSSKNKEKKDETFFWRFELQSLSPKSLFSFQISNSKPFVFCVHVGGNSTVLLWLSNVSPFVCLRVCVGTVLLHRAVSRGLSPHCIPFIWAKYS